MPGSGLLGVLRARPRLLAAFFGFLLVIGCAGAGLAIGSFQAVCRDCPSIAQISVWQPQQSTKVFAHDGRLIQELFLERRTPVSLSQLPPHVPLAFVAVEDKRFYSHSGLDFIRIMGAAVRNVLSGRVTGGASTITQQLARNIFATDINWIDEIQGDVTFWQRVKRKLKEVHVALQLEQVYTKDQILEAYLNQIHYGHGWYGIETASSRYFGKSASELNPAEAASLAAVVKLWGQYSPFRNPSEALARRNMVLRLMGDQGVIPAHEVRRWQEEPLPEEAYGVGETDLAPYFVEWVRSILDERYGYDLYSSGLRVYTTLDLDMQRHALTAMQSGWNRIESVPGYRHPKYADVIANTDRVRGTETPYIQGMFIAMDPHTGAIRALVGGRDFSDSRFNRAVQALRQPGSAFKPFVYTAALASGVPPSHVIFDTPISIEQVDGTVWSPSNFTPEFKGPLTLRAALRESNNVVSVKLGLEVGLETVAQYARRMGIQTDIPRVPSMALGAPDVIPIQLIE
ncbi:MAG TPA: transglycosylase domain-containing protein, partial [Longimicrobiales bacterium]|nr:transglycosylase domain-containing protein [Longimicrobiales bacterium]